MHLHRSTLLGSFALAALFGLFLFLVHQADQAMGKSGIGNFVTWESFNIRAGFAFYSLVTVWVALLVLGLVSKGTKRSQLFFLCGFSLLLAPILWLLTMIVA